jgi:hypothetical protein
MDAIETSVKRMDDVTKDLGETAHVLARCLGECNAAVNALWDQAEDDASQTPFWFLLAPLTGPVSAA